MSESALEEWTQSVLPKDYQLSTQVLGGARDLCCLIDPYGYYATDLRPNDPNQHPVPCVFVERDPQTLEIRKFGSTMNYKETMESSERANSRDGVFYVVLDLDTLCRKFANEEQHEVQSFLSEEQHEVQPLAHAKVDALMKLLGFNANSTVKEMDYALIRALEGGMAHIHATTKENF